MYKIIGSRIATNFTSNLVRKTYITARSINFYSHLRVKDLDNNNEKANTSPTINYDHIVDISINDPNFEVSYHNNNGRTYRISIKQEVSMNLENGYCEEVSVNTKTVPKDDSEQ